MPFRHRRRFGRYRRRHNRPRRPPQPNIFMKVWKKIPRPTPSTFIFPWILKAREFNTQSYTEAKAAGKISSSEVNQILTDLRKSAVHYKINGGGSDHVGVVLCIGLIIGIAVLITFISIISILPYIGLGFMGSCCLTFCMVGCLTESWKRKVRARAASIRRELIKINTRFGGRVILTAGSMGEYLKIDLRTPPPPVVRPLVPQVARLPRPAPIALRPGRPRPVPVPNNRSSLPPLQNINVPQDVNNMGENYPPENSNNIQIGQQPGLNFEAQDFSNNQNIGTNANQIMIGNIGQGYPLTPYQPPT